MAKQVDIKYVAVQTPITIVVDGVEYPITGRNIDIVREYEQTKNESVLDNLSTMVLSFGEDKS